MLIVPCLPLIVQLHKLAFWAWAHEHRGHIRNKQHENALGSGNIFSRACQRLHAFPRSVLLVFSVTPYRIDQNRNQNRSIDKIQDLRKERREICKDPRQVSGHSNFAYATYAEKRFTQIYIDLYGDAMLVTIWMGTTWRLETKRNICHWAFLVTYSWIYFSRNSKALK